MCSPRKNQNAFSPFAIFIREIESDSIVIPEGVWIRTLILGATGMLGYSLFSNLREFDGLYVFGPVRNTKGKEKLFEDVLSSLIFDVDVTETAGIERAIASVKPVWLLIVSGLLSSMTYQNSMLMQ
jgi:hypothetical protein